jgi:hypothetical protein
MIFILKFSTEMLIRKMNGTLTHNGLGLCLVAENTRPILI